MVAPANEEMAKAWDGEEGARWAQDADRFDRAGRRHLGRLLSAAGIGPSERVLDIGCGTGRSTREAARAASAGWALGVDLSGPMLACARKQAAAEGLGNVSFLQADAQVHPFEPAALDVAVSHFGAMFFADQVAAFANIAGGLRPGGRLALLAWRELARNEWLTALRGALAAGRELPEPPPGAPGPFGLADEARDRAVLAEAGFEHVALTHLEEPLDFGDDADDAFAFLRTQGIVIGLTQDLDHATTERALDELHAVLAAHQTGDGVLLGTSAWLITATRG